MGRFLAYSLLLFAFVACGGGSSKKSDVSQTGDTTVESDTTAPNDTVEDSVSETDTAKGPDLAVAPLTCSTACGGTVCGEATCYTCDPDDKCADISSSLWDQGIFGQALWGP